MPLNNLRSVLAQVTGGGRSVVCRRNLSTRSRCNLCARCRHNLSTRSRHNSSSFRNSYESDISYPTLFGYSLKFGFSVGAVWEIIQMIEYVRTIQRSLDEHAGLVSEAPLRDGLLSVLRDLQRRVSGG